MKRLVIGCAAAGLASLATGWAMPPAEAGFYSLDGRFQCLDRGEAVCGDPQPLMPARPVVTAAPPVAAVVPAPSPRQLPPPPIVHRIAAPLPPPRPEDPLAAIAGRVQMDRPARGDLLWLKQAAQTGNPRAIELLAWCELNAIGTPRDPVEAYILYGAARGALPHARENQAAIYERDLDPDQRQQVLDLVNDGVALARLPRSIP
ncbi:MAG TPA: hypothetical protein VNF99_14005 [Stellaceae bacterium]|nr:hypothetical protein [Stellaceae bacterium]